MMRAAFARRLAVVLVLGSLLLAGCTGAGDPLPPSGIRGSRDVEKFDGYTWSQPQFSDSRGNLLPTHPVFGNNQTAPKVVYQLLPENGPEPSVGVTKKGNIFVSNRNQVQRSGDYGRTWTNVYEYESPTTDNTYTTLDPMMWVDPDTDWIFNTHLQILQAQTVALPWCIYLAHSKNEGQTWSDDEGPGGDANIPGVNSCLVGVSDHQKIGTAKLGPKTDPAVRAQYENTPGKYVNVLYYCHQKYDVLGLGETNVQGQELRQNPFYGTWCETSFDAGNSWTYSTQISKYQEGCPAGINGQPARFPTGEVAVPLGHLGNCNPPPTVVISEDSGRTWIERRMPNLTIGQREIDPDITVTPDGTAYLTWRSKDHHVYLARSKDKFVTWEGPWRVSPRDQIMNAFVSIVNGDNGRVAIAYLGTRDAQEKQAEPDNATGGTSWHAFVSYSFDADQAEPSFYTVQVNPQEDPVQVGCIWFKGGAGGPRRCRNLLDFIDAAVDTDGRVIVAITDGCTPRNGCSGDTDSMNFQSHDRDAAVLVHDSGLSLFAEKGTLPAIGLVPPKPIPRGG